MLINYKEEKDPNIYSFKFVSSSSFRYINFLMEKIEYKMFFESVTMLLTTAVLNEIKTISKSTLSKNFVLT